MAKSASTTATMCHLVPRFRHSGAHCGSGHRQRRGSYLMPAPVITLDGPSGAGKGTLAAALAAELDWRLLDSGALYRVVGWYAVQHGLQPDDAQQIARVAAAAHSLSIEFTSADGAAAAVFCEHADVTAAIRSDQISAAASCWAALPEIRAALLQRQRAFRSQPGLVADGRDMGTVVFPDAELKFYVTASAAERSARRHAQLQGRNQWSAQPDNAILAQIYDEIV